jgi:hypothetical protein
MTTSYNPTWGQQSNISWPDHACSSQSEQYQAEPPPLEFSEETRDPLEEHFDQFYRQVVVENQVDERKEEQTEDLEEPHLEKEESTNTFSTLALIPETPKCQERSLLELPNEQIEDIKIEKAH